jgi:MATE family multidrug resistance protein
VNPPLTLRSELRQLLLLGAPLAVTQAGQTLLGAVDVAVLGRAGAELLGGAGLGNALYFGIGILGMGAMHGLDPLVSQALGSGDAARARRLVWQGLWLALLVSAALAAPIVLSPRLLAPLGIAPAVVHQAERYLSVRALGLPLLFVYFAPRALLVAQNRLTAMLVAVGLANLLNLGLDVLLVFGGAELPGWTGPLRLVPPLGVVGAAWASNAASLFQVVVLGLAVRAELRGLPGAGDRSAAAPDRRELALALRVGVPAGLHMCAEVSFFSVLGSAVGGRLGIVPLAAHQVALQLAGLTFTFIVGLGNAGAARVGLAVGARDRAGARRAGLAALYGATGFMSAAALVFVAFPAPLAKLMTDDADVVAAAVPLLRIAGAFQLLDGLQGVGSGILRGAGDTRYTFAVNMVAYWAVGLPVVLLLAFGLGWGIVGQWTGFVVSLAIVAALLVPRFLRLSSREIAPLAHGPGVNA